MSTSSLTFARKCDCVRNPQHFNGQKRGLAKLYLRVPRMVLAVLSKYPCNWHCVAPLCHSKGRGQLQSLLWQLHLCLWNYRHMFLCTAVYTWNWASRWSISSEMLTRQPSIEGIYLKRLQVFNVFINYIYFRATLLQSLGSAYVYKDTLPKTSGMEFGWPCRGIEFHSWEASSKNASQFPCVAVGWFMVQ